MERVGDREKPGAELAATSDLGPARPSKNIRVTRGKVELRSLQL